LNARQLVQTVWRRRSWLFGELGARKLWNLAAATRDFALKRETTGAMPAVVKIDISPVCNLSCTMCVHADPIGSQRIDQQDFRPEHKMTVEQYGRVIDEIKDTAVSVTLYTWGDPLTHPDLDEMCRIAADAGLQVHISTNFSFKLRDERIESLVRSGLTHLTVCVDGLSQEKYQRTRVGGRIEWVLDNLRRVCELKRAEGREHPIVEVQYIKYQHNLDEVEPARERATELGVDEFADFWGALHNLADHMPDQYEIHGPKPNKSLPQCYWPHYSMVIKYNGDVIPCCEHRAAAQHTSRDDPDARTFGNVFDTSVREVWNNPHYQAARRLVSNPERSESEPALKENFCDGCFVIFDTEIEDSRRWGNRWEFEELYTIGERGRPVRRPGTETGLPT